MVTRQLPNPAELLELMQFKKPELERHASAASTRRSRSPTCARSRSGARRRPRSTTPTARPRASCRSPARARRSRTSSSTPAILRPAPDVDTSVEILGGPSALPFGIAPTGFTRLMQTEGEIAGASAAGAAGIPFTLSTLGTTSIEDVKAANPHGRNWFQLYVMRDREISYGARPPRGRGAGSTRCSSRSTRRSPGARLRDKRNGFSIPPQLTLGTIVNAIPRPVVVVRLPHHRPSSSSRRCRPPAAPWGSCSNAAMDPTISYDDLGDHPRHVAGQDRRQGRAERRGLEAADRRSASTASSSPTTAGASSTARRSRSTCCPKVVREVGKDATVMIDTGIMNGADIVASIALGAKFTLIGRAYLYGLMAGGRQGVDRTIAILRERDRAHHETARRLVARRARAQARDPARAAGAPAPLRSMTSRQDTNGSARWGRPVSVVRVDERQALTDACASLSAPTSAFFLARAAATYRPARVTSRIAP